MTPHLEHFTGKYRHDIGLTATGAIYEEVPNTKHFTGDGSKNAELSHTLAIQDPDNYREVADDAGSVCSGYDQVHLIEQDQAKLNSRNPLVDDID